MKTEEQIKEEHAMHMDLHRVDIESKRVGNELQQAQCRLLNAQAEELEIRNKDRKESIAK